MAQSLQGEVNLPGEDTNSTITSTNHAGEIHLWGKNTYSFYIPVAANGTIIVEMKSNCNSTRWSTNLVVTLCWYTWDPLFGEPPLL